MNLKHAIIFVFFSLNIYSQTVKQSLSLIPWPKEIQTKQGFFKINPEFSLNITGNAHPRIYKAATHFLRRLDGRTGLFLKQGFITKSDEDSNAQLQIHCQRKGEVGIYEDESYSLEINEKSIIIDAVTDIGALHALETLLQLLQNNSDTFFFPNVSISDKPEFKWRGLMIDVARHFQPVEVIKRNIDAMAAVKLNVLHWHLVDDQGWRIELKNRKKLTELASDGYYYTQEEIKNIIQYASERGIVVVPEIDVPGHATAILTAYPEIGSNYKKNPSEQTASSYSIERNAGVFRPTLDPSNPNTYKILSEIFDEVCPLFPGKYFHIGGDENEGKAWDDNPVIQEFKKKKGFQTNHELQSYFTLQLVPMFKKHDKDIVGWEEIMNEKMPKSTIIHSWKGANEGSTAGASLINAVKNGYRTILSNGFYIDLMQSINEHYMSPIIPKNAKLTTKEREHILGGEATMWSELVTAQNIDSRIWPRTIAIAELFWSNPQNPDVSNLLQRLPSVSNRLEELGITHIRNKEVILRNIANYQNTFALEYFSKLCEPLKIYTRNKGGTEYHMYSPFTLFADACTVDASEALQFNWAVNQYLKEINPTNLASVTSFFEQWKTNHKELVVLSENAPLIQPILPLSESLSLLSEELLQIIHHNKEYDTVYLNQLWEKCNSKEYADVELAVVIGLKKMIENLK
ncbi:family 20 glycosylhydrolase [Flavobacterium sp. TP390]|uniref:Family 20 glycosylhydrolase n=1 Tax=Flavobacterium profundi TaxID=1774945 RepID=A0A6I4ILP9_9FLAO|nr:family 20 glycosylhydrolase [Flavobacterium profundi]MVO09362.1 family 20 glycosylhydrolase [Flavobacterium profundi]